MKNHIAVCGLLRAHRWAGKKRF